MQRVIRPEYIWRPAQAWRRIAFRPSRQVAALPLAWGCTIEACSAETIGSSIAKQGVYDLPLTEAIVRLTDAGDIAVDAGANIGYMSLVLARAAGPSGRVLSFEPNPAVLPTLRSNANNWSALECAPIHIEPVALSDRDGEGVLGYPEEYATNQGVASLEVPAINGVTVTLRRLDSLTDSAGIMKIDVEGHEAAVFAGAERLLRHRLIRDILFEEHDPYPALSHRALLRHGYELFRITRSTWRPLLLPPEASARQKDLPSNYLATTAPARARRRFADWGWRALSSTRGTDFELTASPA